MPGADLNADSLIREQLLDGGVQGRSGHHGELSRHASDVALGNSGEVGLGEFAGMANKVAEQITKPLAHLSGIGSI